MKTALFDFDLPDSLIATHPVQPRDSARLLVLSPAIQDRIINELPNFLKAGDVVVFNDTRVIPARLFGKRGEAKSATPHLLRGPALIEILLHKRMPDTGPRHTAGIWQCFAKPAKKLRVGDQIVFADDFHATILDKLPSGEVVLQFDDADDLFAKLSQHGHMPLPPYITRADNETDREHYQTVYAKNEGAVAAPTAGLHFTERLLKAMDEVGIKKVHITLHVGGGTFLPVKVEDTGEHVMHSEYAIITPEAADTINAAKAAGGRVIAVGTTSLRTLESATDSNGKVHPFSQETDIFITPGYRFKIVDMLLTNFHLPRSTLFMLVAAFSGLESIKEAYAHAIANQYRFYSYGDACLLYCRKNII